MKSLGRIYDKVWDGNELTDSEVMAGEKLFKNLTNQLFAAGPMFILTAKETNRTYHALRSVRRARKLVKLS